MSKQTATADKLAELSKLLEQAKATESEAVMKAGPYGNDLVDLYNKIKALIDSLGLGDISTETIHAVLHFAIDWLNKIKPTLPMWQGFAVLAIVKALEMIDKKFHPEPNPTV